MNKQFFYIAILVSCISLSMEGAQQGPQFILHVGEDVEAYFAANISRKIKKNRIDKKDAIDLKNQETFEVYKFKKQKLDQRPVSAIDFIVDISSESTIDGNISNFIDSHDENDVDAQLAVETVEFAVRAATYSAGRTNMVRSAAHLARRGTNRIAGSYAQNMRLF